MVPTLIHLSESIINLQKPEKLEILNRLLIGTGLIAIPSDRLEDYIAAAQLRLLKDSIESDERVLLSAALAEFLESHPQNDDLHMFLEKSIEFVSKETTKRRLQIIARQIYEQFRINPVILDQLVQNPEVLNFYMQFKCSCTQAKLIQIAKQIAR